LIIREIEPYAVKEEGVKAKEKYYNPGPVRLVVMITLKWDNNTVIKK
jgi:hypothetical protein